MIDVSIRIEVDDDSADVPAIVAAARADVAALIGDGYTVASATLDAGDASYDLTKSGTPLDDAVDDLATAVSVIDAPDTGDVTVTAEQWAALVAAAQRVETEAGNVDAPAPSSTTPDPSQSVEPAPASSGTASPTPDPTGTTAADVPDPAPVTNDAGDTVAL